MKNNIMHQLTAQELKKYKVGDRVIIGSDPLVGGQTGTVIRVDKLKIQLDNAIKIWPLPQFVFPHIDHM